MGVVLGIGALNLKPVNNDAQDAATRLSGLFKQTRAKAMATTSAYRIWADLGSQPVRIYAQKAQRCNAPSNTWVTDEKLQVKLPDGVTMGLTKWDYQLPCFNSRGLSSNAITLKLTDNRERVRVVELLLGGAVRVK